MTGSGTTCSQAVEDVFGPVVASSCLGGFDFTLLFEEAILTLLPLGIASVWSVFRLWILFREPAKVRSSWLLAGKMLALVVYEALQIGLIAPWASDEEPKTRLTLACISLTIVCYLLISVLSYLEHVRSIRPSTMLTIYLGISLILDLARTRTLFFMPLNQSIPRVNLSAFCIKLVYFLLEITEKRHLFYREWKEVGPETASGTLNRALFLWLNRLFIRGFRKLLTVGQLTKLDEEILSASEPTTIIEKWKCVDKLNSHALFWLFAKHYKWAILAGVLPRLAYAGFNFSQPYLVQRVLDFTADTDGPDRESTGYALIGAYALSYIGLSLSYAVYQHKTYRLLTLYRGSLVSIIFDKTLRVKCTAADDAEAITLMSADIDRITSSMHLIHELYASVIEIGIALWLLYNFLGLAMVAPTGWIIVCILAGIPIARAAGNAQIPWLEAIEERLASTANALRSLKVVRMTGLSDVVSTQISRLRIAEIRASRRHRIFNILVSITSFSSSSLAPIWGFMAYILIAKARDRGALTEGVAFGALSLFELINQPVQYVIDGMEDVQTVINSFGRIQQYLESEEREDYRLQPDAASPSSSQIDDDSDLKETFLSWSEKANCAAFVADVSARYTEDGHPVLHNCSFQILRGEVTMIHGPLGCGKSTLLKLLLGEIPFTTGSTYIASSKVAYCPQSPWCSWGTVRENIIGMSGWDEVWYKSVISACALSTDFEQLALGDHSPIGTQGSKLSGGQQMRVSLARALYSRNRMMILDDVVTGLDRETEQHILSAVFGPHGLLKNLQTTVILATNSYHHLRFADKIILLTEGGSISKQSTFNDLFANEEEFGRFESQDQAATARPQPEIPEDVLHELKMLEDPDSRVNRSAGDMKIYAFYAKAAGWWTSLFYLLACAIFVFGVSFPSIWVQWWANANAIHPNERIGYWLGVFAALSILTILGAILADWALNLVVLPKTSKTFHELLLSTTMRAPTSFLTSTDAGTTVNRFSQDLELIDNDLPQALDSVVFQAMSAVVSAILIFIGSGYVAASIPICLVVLYLLQYYYLRTSRQMRILDIEAKAPLFSHFLQTVQGVACIRAYGWTSKYAERNIQALNMSQRPYYLLFCLQRWLTLVLDLLNAGIAILMVGIVTNIKGGSTSYLGVALYNIVTFSSTLQTLVTEWTQVEMSLGAISRIRTYVATVKDENLPSETDILPDNWPQQGNITFDNICASHDSSQEPVLKDINLSIKAGEKVAICGRTGSGKSSLISTLFRMMETSAGTIVIDDIDINTIPRQEIRSKLNSLPQESFFLEGTVRDNLDPTNDSNDDRMIEVLTELGIWNHFESNDGLDGGMADDTLSHGQRQLFCLARAMIKPGNIVIMDEATSSTDSQTDELMQRMIRREFDGRTIIAVAHRLHTILDFDRVIMLDAGRIIESGQPTELLATETSAFRALYEKLEHEKSD